MGRFLEHFLKMDLACSIFFNIKSKTWKVEILFPCLPLQFFFSVQEHCFKNGNPTP